MESGNRSPKKILVVDDDDMHCDILQTALRMAGFKPDCASNGQEALEKVKTATPDLIVMDLQMPVMSGYEAIRQLKATGHGSIPVIVLSAHAHYTPSAEETASFSESNVCDFIDKPVVIKNLIKRIGEILNIGNTLPAPPGPQ